jgi:hypothetical protein
MRKMRNVCIGLSDGGDYREKHGGNRPKRVYQMLRVHQKLFYRCKMDGGLADKADG